MITMVCSKIYGFLLPQKNRKKSLMTKETLTKDALLTAIIFTYNHEEYIEQCITSIINQKTDYKYEIHIYDDCSKDNTSNICRHYAKLYPDKIKLLVQQENTFLKPYKETQSYLAFQNIRTKYFCYIDGDDYWCDENKIQIALNFLENNPEYVGFAHDTMQINTYDKTSSSYVHEIFKYNITNPVSLSPDSPFLLASSRILRNCGYDKKHILPVDYLLYYYHLSKGPIYYYDKIMACYIIGENSTFASLGEKINDLNGMFSYKLSLLFNYKQDDFCTGMQRWYDNANGVGLSRYNKLLLFKRLFGIRLGWTLWFLINFVKKYGFQCMNINYVYPRKSIKQKADEKILCKQ